MSTGIQVTKLKLRSIHIQAIILQVVVGGGGAISGAMHVSRALGEP